MSEAAVAARPSFPFPLQDGETVLEVKHRHWLYLWPSIAALLVLALVPIAVLGLLIRAAGGYEGTVARIYWIAAALYFAYWAARIFLTWYRYQHDIWVITNQRLIDSRKRHPFSMRISTVDLVNVQDMTIERDGILRTVFDFGDVVCQTAAEMQDFRIGGVPDPRAVQALVDRERDRERLRARGA